MASCEEKSLVDEIIEDGKKEKIEAKDEAELDT